MLARGKRGLTRAMKNLSGSVDRLHSYRIFAEISLRQTYVIHTAILGGRNSLVATAHFHLHRPRNAVESVVIHHTSRPGQPRQRSASSARVSNTSNQSKNMSDA